MVYNYKINRTNIFYVNILRKQNKKLLISYEKKVLMDIGINRIILAS